MSQVVETHIRKRGLFGWFFLILFWAFNAFMAVWAWLTFSLVSRIDAGPSAGARAGYAIGSVIDVGALAFLWLAGTVILGLCVVLTRGTKTIVIKSPGGVAAGADQTEGAPWTATAPGRAGVARLTRSDHLRAAGAVALGLLLLLVMKQTPPSPVQKRTNAEQNAAHDLAMVPSRWQSPSDLKPAETGTAWHFEESKSPLDDSPEVTATNASRTDGGADAYFGVLCKEHKTGVGLMAHEFWGVSIREHFFSVIMRVKGERAVERQWAASGGFSLHGAIFLPPDESAPSFVAALPETGKVFFRVTDFQGRSHDMTFRLDGLAEVKARVGAACNWPAWTQSATK